MIETIFRTEDLPEEDRFACWHEMTCRSAIPTLIRCDDGADFRAVVRILDLGAMQLVVETFPALHTERTPKLIRQSDPEQYQLSFFVRGEAWITQARRDATLRAGDLVLFDSSRPFRGRTVPGDNSDCCDLRVQFSRSLLPLRASAIDRFIAVRQSGREGIGALLSGCLRELSTRDVKYRAVEVSRLAAIAMDLLATLLAHELHAMDALPPETHQRVLWAQIFDFIEQHLGDPTLSPAMIASAHHISSRHLHRLFMEHSTTIASWIRQRRLEHCRRDLSDPYQHSRPIQVIAARWGFTDNAHFSRLFRSMYGMPPRDYRQLQSNAKSESSIRARRLESSAMTRACP